MTQSARIEEVERSIRETRFKIVSIYARGSMVCGPETPAIVRRHIDWITKCQIQIARLSGVDAGLYADHVPDMCNLYKMNRTRAEIARLFQADDRWSGDLEKDYMSPGRPAPVVILRSGERITGLMSWGVPNGDIPITNVRNLESPFWRDMLARPAHRCLVPVTEFEEWSTERDQKTGRKVAYWFRLPARPMFAFAGIWRKIGDAAHFAFLTTVPNALVGAFHPKAMPVILNEGDYDLWLTGDWANCRRLVAPYPSELMVVSGS